MNFVETYYRWKKNVLKYVWDRHIKEEGYWQTHLDTHIKSMKKQYGTKPTLTKTNS